MLLQQYYKRNGCIVYKKTTNRIEKMVSLAYYINDKKKLNYTDFDDKNLYWL